MMRGQPALSLLIDWDWDECIASIASDKEKALAPSLTG